MDNLEICFHKPDESDEEQIKMDFLKKLNLCAKNFLSKNIGRDFSNGRDGHKYMYSIFLPSFQYFK